MFNNVAQWWKQFVSNMNSNGIPVPTIRDPKTKVGSVSFTMVCVSFGLMVLCVLVALAMVVNNWGKFFGPDTTTINDVKDAFWMAFEMCGLSAGLYWGRKFQNDGQNINVGDASNNPNDGK